MELQGHPGAGTSRLAAAVDEEAAARGQAQQQAAAAGKRQAPQQLQPAAAKRQAVEPATPYTPTPSGSDAPFVAANLMKATKLFAKENPEEEEQLVEQLLQDEDCLQLLLQHNPDAWVSLWESALALTPQSAGAKKCWDLLQRLSSAEAGKMLLELVDQDHPMLDFMAYEWHPSAANPTPAMQLSFRKTLWMKMMATGKAVNRWGPCCRRGCPPGCMSAAASAACCLLLLHCC